MGPWALACRTSVSYTHLDVYKRQVEEMAEWTYFLAVVNKSMTAQDVLIDNGEIAKANFVW